MQREVQLKLVTEKCAKCEMLPRIYILGGI